MDPIYSYQDYKEYINDRIRSQKNRGRGTYSKIAKFLGVSNVLVSQVLNGDRNFVRDKAFSLCLFFKMNELETDFFMTLYEANVATGEEHKKFLMARLGRIKIELIENQLDRKDVVSKEFQKVYYSSWLYSATRLSLMKTGVDTANDISRFLGFPVSTIQPILDFLVEANLVSKGLNGSYHVSDKNLHVPKDSEHVMNHHMNLKNLEINRIIDGVHEDEVCYSSLVVTSRKVVDSQIAKLKKVIKESSREFSKGESEDLVLFNLSLLNMSKKGQSTEVSA